MVFFHGVFLALFFFSSTLTSIRSCSGHASLIIQEGHARAGQTPQPRRDGQNPDPDSSKHWLEEEEMFRGKPLVEVIRCPDVGVAVGVSVVVAKRGESCSAFWPCRRLCRNVAKREAT
jgi:hypothetical protein